MQLNYRQRMFCCMILAVLLLHAKNMQAQTGNIWTPVNKSKKAAEKKVKGMGTKVKQFKTYLQQWGLDANYNHGLAIGARLNSTGWTGLLNYQRRISKTQSHFFQLSFSELIHEKQIKQQRQNTAYPQLGNSSPFVFGKINNVY